MTQPLKERLVAALAEHDAAVSECRIDGVRPQLDTSKACDRCGAGPSESCGAKTGAAYAFIQSARSALNEGV